MLERLVILGPTRFTEETERAFAQLAREVVYMPRIPRDNMEMIRQIGCAEALLVALEVYVGREVIAACPALRYIGMCCSLYGPQSANVDKPAAEERGITVTGIRDYGDEGVVEYAISELVRLLHGFGGVMWRDQPTELTDVRCGILGMGTLGRLISDALLFFGAKVSYFSRTRKADVEAKGVAFEPLERLLAGVDICIACLNKNAILLHEGEFAAFGNGKILMNIAIGPCSDDVALASWLGDGRNFFLCDTPAPLGDSGLLALPNVLCVNKSAGASIQSNRRYNEKILANLLAYLQGQA